MQVRLCASFWLLLTCACANVWAGGIASEVANGMAKIKSYQGTTSESGLGQEVVERTVVYARPWMSRIETTAPAAHAGELFIYDGSTMTLWWPQALVGVKIHGAQSPDAQATLQHIERQTKINLKAYSFDLRSETARVAGQPALEWLVRPTRKEPYRMGHKVWNHKTYTMPLRMEFSDAERQPWYTFAYTSLAFDVPVDPKAFEFAFPPNAVVFEWDLRDPGVALDAARAQMNFDVRLPVGLPPGHDIKKVIRGKHCLPMIMLIMDNGATTLSLTEMKATGAEQPLGKEVMIGQHKGSLSFMGPLSTVSWVQNGTSLTLTSNLDFPRLIAIAAQVQ